MPDYFIELVFSLLALVYLTLYFRSYLKRNETGHSPKKAWLRIGVIFAIVSGFLIYQH